MTRSAAAEALAAAVVSEALSWVKTRYHHGQGVKGVGVDCAMLLVGVYAACGHVPPDLDPRPYAPDWHLHRSDEVFLNWVLQFATEVPAIGPALAADVQLWQYARCYSHGAICLGEGQIVHAVRSEHFVVLGDEASAELLARPMRRFRLPVLLDNVASKRLDPVLRGKPLEWRG